MIYQNRLKCESLLFKVPRFVAGLFGVELSNYQMFRKFKSCLMSAKGSLNPAHRPIIRKYVKKGDLVVEVGAFEGDYIKLYEKIGAYVLAFEPNSISFSNLKKKNFKNTKLFNVGLGSSDYKKRLSLDGPQSSFIFVPRNSQWEEAEIHNLDKYSLNKLDFIKIDTEGMDFEVLLGARETLRKFKPVVLMEYNKKMLELTGHNIVDVVKFMYNLGYEFQTVQTIIWGISYTQDILFIPQDKFKNT